MGIEDKNNTSEIALPELLLGPIKYSIGYAQQVLQKPQTIEIVSEEQIPISPRITERCLTLKNEERIIVTERTSITRPSDVDGVLRLTSSGAKWLNHIKLDKARKIIRTSGMTAISDSACSTWVDAIRYIAEKPPVVANSNRGLRPPQLGALFAVGSHWSLFDTPATIVMPTGTGKTETMLSVVAAHQINRTLVAVPSKALRIQTANKFMRFGLLRDLNVLHPEVENPVVGIALNRPKSSEDLALFRDCNVVVGIPSSLANGTALTYLSELAKIVDTLIVDEAHHVAALTWSNLRDAFSKNRVLQFTATPFRNDNKLVDGTVIYSYPLIAAQKDNYFTKINFQPVYEIDDDIADEVIAAHAIQQLRKDENSKLDHLLMARCRTVNRAIDVHRIYEKLAPEYSPLLIHSDLTDADQRIEYLHKRESRIVVCVNMLGEGVDIPALKIAAIHDSHQSLAVLLQFIGRFTRKTDNKHLGEASVVANIANIQVSQSLEQLYSQDADWNELLRELSSAAAKEHSEFIRFLEHSKPFKTDVEDSPSVSQQSLRPTFSTLFFHASKFKPKQFHKGLSDRNVVVKVWLNEDSRTLYFVTCSSDRVKWTRSKELKVVQWDLFVLHHDNKLNLLYLASTNKSSHFENLAKAVGASSQITGEMMFRSLGRIGRLVFNNLGVTKHGRRNLSFAMYTGVDVKHALSEAETQGSRKSNISGYGWEDGKQITIGCSYKGRVWSKMAGTLPKFITWAEGVGSKLLDDSIDTKSIIENVLIPDWAKTFPEYEVLSLDWPYELFSLSEDRVSIIDDTYEYELFLVDLVYESINEPRKQLTFSVVTGEEQDIVATFNLTVNGQTGFNVTEVTSRHPGIRVGSKEFDLIEYFNNYPPLVRFVDLSEVDGNILLKSENSGVIDIPQSRLIPWSWQGVDITKESIWKNGTERKNSIQWRVAEQYINDGFTVVFDDDGAGEAADLVCLHEEDTHIRLVLIHCKYSGDSKEGKRIKDVVDVSSQAVRSARRPGSFKRLVEHIIHRYKNRNISADRKLFLAGDRADISRIEKASRFKEVRPEIVIVQPGVSKSNLTQDQSIILGAAVAYVKQTLGLDIDVICSK